MTYLAQSQLTTDHHLIGRVAAAAATQGEYGGTDWARTKMWRLSAEPEWATRYRDALAAVEVPEDPAAAPSPNIGRDPEVITDPMILSGVCNILGIPFPHGEGFPEA